MKKHFPLIVRIIISALFLLSAVAKSYPIWAFEKQLVDLGIVDWCKAPYLARLIIAMETAIAIAILQKNFIRSFVIPVTIALLVAFCVHLGIQMYEHGAMNGNCGCFGQLIPMTPLEAFIKNIVTIALLVYLYKNVTDKPKGQNSFIALLFIYFLSAFLLFFIFPFCPCVKEESIKLPIVNETTNDSSSVDVDSSTIDLSVTSDYKKSKDSIVKETSGKDSNVVTLVNEPTFTQSKFSAFTNFSGKKVNLDKGKKIVCLFVPGCDHCRDAAKELASISKTHKLPPIYVLFMNEETYKIPEFFTETKMPLPYFVMDDIPGFFKLLGNKATTPGLFYLWNGNIIKSYEGLEDHKFNAAEIVKIIESNQK